MRLFYWSIGATLKVKPFSKINSIHAQFNLPLKNRYKNIAQKQFYHRCSGFNRLILPQTFFMRYLLLLSILFTNFAEAQYRLALNLEKGNTYIQRSSADLTINQEINGQKMDIVSTISGIMGFKVVEKSASSYILETVYTELNMSMKTPNGEVSFSSTKPYDEKDIFSRLLKNMIDHPFYINMQSTGKITEIKGIDSLWTNIFSSFPELDADKKEQILAQLKQSYGENSLRGNIEQLTAIFPSQKVKINDQWQNSIELRTTMHATINNHFKLLDYNPSYFDIENHADTRTSDDTVQTNGMSATYKLAGPTDSRIKIDTKTGWIIEANTHMELKGTLQLLDNPKIPGGMLIAMDMTSVSKVTDK